MTRTQKATYAKEKASDRLRAYLRKCTPECLAKRQQRARECVLSDPNRREKARKRKQKNFNEVSPSYVAKWLNKQDEKKGASKDLDGKNADAEKPAHKYTAAELRANPLLLAAHRVTIIALRLAKESRRVHRDPACKNNPEEGPAS